MSAEDPESINIEAQKQFLTFRLAENSYGIPILKVNEIIGITEITPIPKAEKSLKGIINLRGKIIPILDLRLKFEIEEKEYDSNTCIIIINIEIGNDTKQIGVVVDIVSEVCDINVKDIESAPNLQSENMDFLSGIGKIKDQVIMLLDIEKLLYENAKTAFEITD